MLELVDLSPEELKQVEDAEEQVIRQQAQSEQPISQPSGIPELASSIDALRGLTMG